MVPGASKLDDWVLPQLRAGVVPLIHETTPRLKRPAQLEDC